MPRLSFRAAMHAAPLMLALTTPGVAQEPNSGVSIGPSQQLSQTPQGAPNPAIPQVEHLFGDWGGVRTSLGNLGVNFIIDETSEFAGNVSGGVKQGSTFANQIGFETDIDWQKLAGIPGLTTHTVIVNRSGSSDSHLFGDNLIPVQEIYGSGGDTVVHLVYAYAEESLLDGRLDIAIGRMPVANDFSASPLYCNFMNNGLCGNPKSLPGGDIGFSSYPDAVWGGRIRARPIADAYVQFGVYEVNQGLYNYANFRSGFKFDGSQDSGVEAPVEIGYEPKFGPGQLPGHYKVGFAYDSSSTYTDFSPLPSATLPKHSGNSQFWLLADQMLVRTGSGAQDGLIALGGFIHNDPRNSVYAEQYFAGLLARGFWTARPADTIGLLFTYNTVSGQLGKAQALEQEFGLPFSNNATGIQSHEMILEANYDIHVFRGVNFEPDFQYVFRPNAQGNTKDAAVFGFKSHVSF